MGKYNKTAISRKLEGITEGEFEHLGIPELTQSEIESITGVPKQQINSYINGTIPRMDTVVKLSEGLGVSVDFLVKDEVVEPKADTQAIFQETGLSSDAFKILKTFKLKKEINLPLVINALELLIKNAGNWYNDPLTAIGKFLQLSADDTIYLLNEKRFDDFEDILNSSNSVEDIRNEYEKLIHGSPETLDSNGQPPAIQTISRNQLLLQNIQNELSSLKRTLWSDIEEVTANNLDNDDVIPVDWSSSAIL
ncbi:MAG TPA: helix-turn-helix transcriptional regulator [Clostridiales bacterium]|nr:helix-turn-helix transcriptional regulator [Clostridiales bacterium]